MQRTHRTVKHKQQLYTEDIENSQNTLDTQNIATGNIQGAWQHDSLLLLAYPQLTPDLESDSEPQRTYIRTTSWEPTRTHEKYWDGQSIVGHKNVGFFNFTVFKDGEYDCAYYDGYKVWRFHVQKFKDQSKGLVSHASPSLCKKSERGYGELCPSVKDFMAPIRLHAEL